MDNTKLTFEKVLVINRSKKEAVVMVRPVCIQGQEPTIQAIKANRNWSFLDEYRELEIKDYL